MTFLSIRLSVAMMCAAGIVVAGGVALAISLSYTLEAAEGYATQYVSATSETGKRKFEDYIDIPLRKATSLQTAIHHGRLPFSVNKTTVGREAVYATWLQLLYAATIETNLALVYLAVGIEDGSYMDCWNDGNPEVECRFMDYLNRTADNKSTYYGEFINSTTGQLIRSEWTGAAYDPRVRPWYKSVNSTLYARRWSEVYLSYDVFPPLVDLNAAIVAPNGAFLGVFGFTFRLSLLSGILLELPRTANGHIVLVDNKHYLLASSAQAKYPVDFSVPNTPGSSRPRPDCSASASLYACRESITSYPVREFDALRSAMPDLYVGGSPHAHRVTLATGVFYASVAAIESKGAADMNWRLMTVVPEEDITAAITTGRNLAIIFVAVAVVVCVVLAAVGTWLLLRPLQQIATRMYQAATFAAPDDGTDTDSDKTSALAEVAMIQGAFNALSKQVRRARQYLPASLLLDGTEIADESDDEGEASCHSTSAGDGSTTMGKQTPSRHSMGRKSVVSSASGNAKKESESRTSGKHVPVMIAGKEHVVAALRSDLGLVRRKATVAYINMRGFNDRVTAMGPEAVVLAYRPLVDLVSKLAEQHRGILDTFHGDRFVLTFNAARPCSSHALSAVGTCAALAKVSRAASVFTCGVASGQLAVGNLGGEMRRFNAIGDAFSRATALERLCKTYSVSVMLDKPVATESEILFHCVCIDAVPALQRRGTGFEAVFALLGPRRQGAQDEWMYEISVDGPDPAAMINEAIRHAAAGDNNRALEALRKCRQQLAGNTGGPHDPLGLVANVSRALGRILGEPCGVEASARPDPRPDPYSQQIPMPQSVTLLGIALGRFFSDGRPSKLETCDAAATWIDKA